MKLQASNKIELNNEKTILILFWKITTRFFFIGRRFSLKTEPKTKLRGPFNGGHILLE